MGYAIQTSSEKSHRRTSSSSEKTASGDFFTSPIKSRLENSPNSLKTSQKKLPTPTKNALGVLFEHYRYTAFGEPEIYVPDGTKLAATAIDNPVLWNSRRYDQDTNLYYYKYRHYEADIGRWLGRDPIEKKGGINLHAFVENRPLNYWDRLGLEAAVAPPIQRGGRPAN